MRPILYALLLPLALVGRPEPETIETPQPIELHETDYSKAIAERLGGIAEACLFDSTRVDVLTDTEAIEVEWAPKYAEAIGQATWYSICTGKRPVIYLLVKHRAAELRYIYRCLACGAKCGIEVRLEEIEQ